MVTRSFLVIETKAGAALLVSDRLAQFNSNVCALAVSGRQAIGLAARRRPGQAMVDVRLKGDLDGPDTARALGAQLDNPSILLSGDPEALHTARSKGVAPPAVLEKPYTPAQLEPVLAGGFVQR
jgi:two-component system, response regulator PdtaR